MCFARPLKAAWPSLCRAKHTFRHPFIFVLLGVLVLLDGVGGDEGFFGVGGDNLDVDVVLAGKE